MEGVVHWCIYHTVLALKELKFRIQKYSAEALRSEGYFLIFGWFWWGKLFYQTVEEVTLHGACVVHWNRECSAKNTAVWGPYDFHCIIVHCSLLDHHWHPLFSSTTLHIISFVLQISALKCMITANKRCGELHECPRLSLLPCACLNYRLTWYPTSLKVTSQWK